MCVHVCARRLLCYPGRSFMKRTHYSVCLCVGSPLCPPPYAHKTLSAQRYGGYNWRASAFRNFEQFPIVTVTTRNIRTFGILAGSKMLSNPKNSWDFQNLDHTPFIRNSPAGFCNFDLGRNQGSKPTLNIKNLGLGSASPYILPRHTFPNFVKPG